MVGATNYDVIIFTITAVEAVGVEHRGGYYDHAGALRDMVQNHLLQLLYLVAMEPMVSFEADEIRNKKVDVLHAVRPIHPDLVHQCVIRGQYGPGWVGGKDVPGYREEDGVSPESQTETFVAIRLFIDNWRWQDVPFYLRTGKRLTRQASEITIQFRGVHLYLIPSLQLLVGLRVVKEKSQRAASCWILNFQSLGRREFLVGQRKLL
jgi:glucose-6-phosphate 1-dehydrogenase